MTKTVVIKAYRSEYPDPLNLPKGESVTVEERKTDWEGWLWATDRSGKSGWIPKNYIDRDGTAGILRRNYSAAELTVESGISVEVIERESGWAVVRTENGHIGWIPEDNLGLEK